MLEEVQPGLRWVHSEGYLHEEIVSFAESSGYDNNQFMNAHGIVNRGLAKYMKRDSQGRVDLATHMFDKDRLPPFDPNHKIRVVVEFIPHKEEADAPAEEPVESVSEPVQAKTPKTRR